MCSRHWDWSHPLHVTHWCITRAVSEPWVNRCQKSSFPGLLPCCVVLCTCALVSSSGPTHRIDLTLRWCHTNKNNFFSTLGMFYNHIYNIITFKWNNFIHFYFLSNKIKWKHTHTLTQEMNPPRINTCLCKKKTKEEARSLNEYFLCVSGHAGTERSTLCRRL